MGAVSPLAMKEGELAACGGRAGAWNGSVAISAASHVVGGDASDGTDGGAAVRVQTDAGPVALTFAVDEEGGEAGVGMDRSKERTGGQRHEDILEIHLAFLCSTCKQNAK